MFSSNEAINTFKELHKNELDQHALTLLERLAESKDAAKTFASLALQTSGQSKLLMVCIEAEQINRHFKEITAVTERLAVIDKYKVMTETLRALVEKIAEEQNYKTFFDRHAAIISEPPENISAMRHGLYLLAGHLNSRETAVKQDQIRLGATRNRHMEGASENAAIYRLGVGVRETTGERNLNAVIELGQIILKMELTEDRVKKAIETRDREWRLP